MPSSTPSRTRLLRAAVAVTAVAALAAVAPVAAQAQTQGRAQALTQAQGQTQTQAQGHRYGYVPITPAAHGSSPHASSSPWGGYAATGSGFRSITGSWSEPTVTCTSRNNLFAPWVGIDGYGSQTVEQTGVETSCSSGRPVYRAWYEMYPAQPVYLSNAVSVGDSFTGSVTTSGNGSYQIALTDNSKGWTYRTTQSLRGSNVSAEAIIESPTQSYPSFSSLTFSGITVNGNTFSAYNPIALASGQYVPTALNGGTFSLVQG